MAINNIKEIVEMQLKDALSKSLDHIPDWVDKNLKSMVLSSLGFSRDSWNGRIEIDHCNGRNSVISDTINAACKSFIEKEVAQYLKTFKLTPAHKDKIKQEFEHAVNVRISREARHEAERQVDSAIAQALKEFINDHVTKHIKQVLTESVDLSDPNFGDKLEEQIRLKTEALKA